MINGTAKRRNGETATKPIRHFRDLEVYQNALAAGLRVYELTKNFAVEEKYSLTGQIRRSSRSVCANIAEAWRKRRYQAAFVSKLSDSESEAAETQVWLQFAVESGYLDRDRAAKFYLTYDEVIRMLVAKIGRAHV